VLCAPHPPEGTSPRGTRGTACQPRPLALPALVLNYIYISFFLFLMPVANTMKRKRTTKAAPAATLSTRIHRILNRAVELKHFSYDTSFNQTSTSTTSVYSNYVSGIIQGTAAGQRIGDRIQIDSITITWVRAAVIAGPSEIDNLQRILLLKSPDKALQVQNLTSVGFTDLVRSSFTVTGPVNTNNYKLFADRKSMYTALPTPGVISGIKEQVLKHKFAGNGQIIQYTPGSSIAVDGSNILVLESRSPTSFAGINWTHYCGVTVAFRDA